MHHQPIAPSGGVHRIVNAAMLSGLFSVSLLGATGCGKENALGPTTPLFNSLNQAPARSSSPQSNLGALFFTFDDRIRDFSDGTITLTAHALSLTQPLVTVNPITYSAVANFAQVPEGIWTLTVNLSNYGTLTHAGSQTIMIIGKQTARVHCAYTLPSSNGLAITVDGLGATLQASAVH